MKKLHVYRHITAEQWEAMPQPAQKKMTREEFANMPVDEVPSTEYRWSEELNTFVVHGVIGTKH